MSVLRPGWLAMLGAVLLSAVPPSPALAADAPLSGRWSGNYGCGNADNLPFELEIMEAENGRLAGTLRFGLEGGQQAALEMKGRSGVGGAFQLAPAGWIDRPEGHPALGLTGTLADAGRRIEGRLTPCAPNSAFRAAPVTSPSAARAARAKDTAPPGGGPFAGHWRGEVSCALRRGPVQTYPVEADIVQDGDQAGALLRLDLPEGRRSPKPVPYRLAAAGIIQRDTLSMSAPIVIEGPPRLRLELELREAGDGRLGGRLARAGGATCDDMRLARAGAPRTTTWPPEMQGSWSAVASRSDVALTVSSAGAMPFAIVEGAYPSDRPADERDHLARVIVPLQRIGDDFLALAVGDRIASGVFSARGRGPTHHALSTARAYLVGGAAGGEISLRPLSNTTDLARGAGSRGVVYRLGRAGGEAHDTAEPPGSPPVRLVGVGGTLAAAPSREAQCGVVRAWIATHMTGSDLGRLSIDAGRRMMLGAFQDDAFQPVFGVSYALLGDDELRGLRNFILDHCVRGQRMADLMPVVGPFVSGQTFMAMNAALAGRNETARWLADTRDAVQDLPADDASLQRIVDLADEARRRDADLPPDALPAFLADLDVRTGDIQDHIHTAEFDALRSAPPDLGTLRSLAETAEAVKISKIREPRRGELVELAGTLAGPIAIGAYDAASARASALPQALDSLPEIQTIWASLGPTLNAMRSFPDDRGERLQPLRAKQSDLLGDPAIQAAFRERLMAIDPDGDPEHAVRAEALRYVTEDVISDGPGGIRPFVLAVGDAILAAEIRSVRFEDRSFSPDAGEPDGKEILTLVMGRLAGVNQNVRELERRCLAGAFKDDAVLAVECLQILAVTGGQGGLRLRLTSFVKLGCTASGTPGRYKCLFEVAQAGNVPALSTGSIGAIFQAPGTQEALFLRDPDGSWTMLWGDLPDR